MATPGRRPRAQQGDGDRLRTELIEAARQLMAEHGSADAVTLRGVARALGVSAPSIYLHFEDRQALVEAALGAQFERLRAAVYNAGAGASTALEALRAGLREYCRFAEHEPGGYAVMFGRAMPANLSSPVGIESFQVLVAGAAACMAEGSFPAGDAFAVARKIWTALHGTMSLRATLPRFAWNPVDEAVDELLADLGAPIDGMVRRP